MNTVRKQHNFKELNIWKRVRAFVTFVYEMTRPFPKEELFCLTQQMRRCAVSVSSNIAEGCGRGTDPQLVHFLDVAYGSACELETQLYLAFDLKYISEQALSDALKEINEIQKMISGFRSTLI